MLLEVLNNKDDSQYMYFKRPKSDSVVSVTLNAYNLINSSSLNLKGQIASPS